MKETFVGDTVKLVLDTKIDISIYNNLEVHYKKPSGLMGHWDGAIGDTNYLMEYTTSVDDLDEDGEWSVQARVSNALETVVLTGKWANFKVYNPLVDTQPAPPE